MFTVIAYSLFTRADDDSKCPVRRRSTASRLPTTSARAGGLLSPLIVMYWISLYENRMRKLPAPDAPKVYAFAMLYSSTVPSIVLTLKVTVDPGAPARFATSNQPVNSSSISTT